ncbi:hypothetical protein CAEBREN_23096 [Caenorhabditis brenneri]|uniref:Uncharacterized protein n=1 Tax=Caenorhabditis brenneri TaxID=135651 RepID=G0NLA1_CAEBE|nr:hypothetical protein CAEBREN_23096 [Caenorhabditis brenneri]
MSKNPLLCDLCAGLDKRKKPKPTQKIENEMERLLFCSLAACLSFTDVPDARRRLNEHSEKYCTDHFTHFADKLFEISGLNPKGQFHRIGVRILEIMTGCLLKKYLEEGSLNHSIRFFLCKYCPKACQVFQEAAANVYPEYSKVENIFSAKQAQCPCLKCGKRDEKEHPRFLEKYYERVGYGIYAGPLVANILNNEMVHAAAVLPNLPLCARHIENDAKKLKNIENMLLDEEKYEAFRKAMLATFGRCVIDALKPMQFFINKYCPRSPITGDDAPTCSSCSLKKGAVFYDEILGKHAHWNCFRDRARDLQWDLWRCDSKCKSRALIAPVPDELLQREGEDFDKVLKAMRRRLKLTEVQPEHYQRIQLVTLFGRYWQHGPMPETVDLKVTKHRPNCKSRTIRPMKGSDCVWFTIETKKKSPR